MKNVIFLVDTGNSKFLIVNTNNKWNLPTLFRVNDTNKIEEKFYKKYNLNIRNIEIIDEKEKYIFIKCITDDKNYDKAIYNVGVINEIQPIISNKLQKQLLFDITLKIGFEILNDSFWLGIILTTEDKIKNEMMKALLTDFLLFFSSSFCEELIIYKFGGVKDPNCVSNKQIKELRKRYFKKCPLYNSKTIKPIINEMGIDFENYIFDNVLLFVDNELIDINSRTWSNRNKDNFELYNGIVLSPRRWIKNFHPQLNDFFEELRNPYIDEFIKRFSEKQITYKSYSTKKLFDNNLTYDEKIYILQRIGLLKTTMFFSKIFRNGNFITINEEENIKVDFDIFLMKVKATLIELLWTDNKKNTLPFLNIILENYPKDICEGFFPINRKCRDNIHYGYYNELTNNDINILNKYQDTYLKYIVEEFEKKLSLNFGLNYRISLALAKIQYWSSH